MWRWLTIKSRSDSASVSVWASAGTDRRPVDLRCGRDAADGSAATENEWRFPRKRLVRQSRFTRPIICVAVALLAIAFAAVIRSHLAEGPGKGVAGGASLAARALRPHRCGPTPVTAVNLDGVIDSMRPRQGQNLSVLLHSLLLFGAGVPLRGDTDRMGALDIVLDADRSATLFDGARALVQTRYGAAFPLVERSTVSAHQCGAQAHRGQALAALATAGIRLDQPIKLDAGNAGTVRMLLDDLCANFALDGEIYWDCLALSLYLPPSWTNKFGERLTFDDLATELISRGYDDSACFGTHQLIALTVLLRVDALERVLSKNRRDAVRGCLRDAVALLSRTQEEVGVWSSNWSKQPIDETPYAKLFGVAPPSLLERVHVTGHHLEWLVLLPDDLRPAEPLLAASAKWLSQTLLAEWRHDPRWPEDNYCTATHALRSSAFVLGADASAERGPH